MADRAVYQTMINRSDDFAGSAAHAEGRAPLPGELTVAERSG